MGVLYIFGTIIITITLFFIYVRLKYKFWALQPVFHFYDIYYWVVNVGIINKELPTINKYVNLNKIKTQTLQEVNKLTKSQIITFIRLNYFRNNENKYEPRTENIIPYFIGHNFPSYWSYFIETELLLDNKTGNTITHDKIIGIITSRPLHVHIKHNKTYSAFDVYYVDYLCVHNRWRRRNIAPQLIQTHEYNQSHNNKHICVSLFKREEELTGIVPLTIYKTYCFDMKKWKHPSPLNPNIHLVTGDKQNLYYLTHFIQETKHKWDILIYPEVSNIIELVSTDNLFIKMLIINSVIVAVYIFRKTRTYIEKDKEIISCIASINGNVLTTDEFISGFKISLYSIICKHINFKYLTIEDISDNNCIINNLCVKTPPNIISPMAYFFYNFAYNTFQSKHCFILN